MAEPHIAQKNPYLIDEQPGTKAWCACGRSANQPYCDGAHQRLDTGIEPVIVKIEEAGTKAWCGCRQTGTPPFCDGAHNKL